MGLKFDLFASAFSKPMKIHARLFLLGKPIKCFAFLVTFCFYVYFQGHMKVALLTALDSRFESKGEWKRTNNHAVRDRQLRT